MNNEEEVFDETMRDGCVPGPGSSKIDATVTIKIRILYRDQPLHAIKTEVAELKRQATRSFNLCNDSWSSKVRDSVLKRESGHDQRKKTEEKLPSGAQPCLPRS